MKKEMRQQIYRMLGVLTFLILMTIWQFDFVITAVSSNIFLNMSIIGGFAFGVVLLYVNTRKMPNEIVAFESLQEFHSDILADESGIALDPYWKYQRCEKPPILFKKPEILGQAYQMIYEQMARSNRLRITPSTMQTLVDGVDSRLFDQKSLMQYITGLLVFLGLIGTFVGLMGTLASVGEIIGGLDLSSGAGVAVIQTLMTNLQKPLVGMATGFSSSLFGLITSLTLGLMSRFAAKHGDLLKMHFENWLAGAAQLDEDSNAELDKEIDEAQNNSTPKIQLTKGGTEAISVMDHRELRLLFRVAKYSVEANQKVKDQLEKLTNSVQAIAEQRQRDQQELSNFAMHVANISTQQKEFSHLMDKTTVALNAQQMTAHHLQNIDNQLEQKFDELNHNSQMLRDGVADEVRKIDARVEQNIGTMNNNLGRWGRNHNEQIEQLRQLLAQNIGDNMPNEPVQDNTELTQMVNQLDNMIKVNQLSADDVSQLKDMSKMFATPAETEVATNEKPHSIRDLFDRIIDNYGEMSEEALPEANHEVVAEQDEFLLAMGDFAVTEENPNAPRFQHYNDDNTNDQSSINDMFTPEK